jgi:hypothetical protein
LIKNWFAAGILEYQQASRVVIFVERNYSEISARVDGASLDETSTDLKRANADRAAVRELDDAASLFRYHPDGARARIDAKTRRVVDSEKLAHQLQSWIRIDRDAVRHGI